MAYEKIIARPDGVRIRIERHSDEIYVEHEIYWGDGWEGIWFPITMVDEIVAAILLAAREEAS